MMGFWGQFARTGNPNGKSKTDAVGWEKWDENQKVLAFDAPQDGGTRMVRHDLAVKSFKQRLFDDVVLSKKERCYVYNGIFRYSDFYDPGDIKRLECP